MFYKFGRASEAEPEAIRAAADVLAGMLAHVGPGDWARAARAAQWIAEAAAAQRRRTEAPGTWTCTCEAVNATSRATCAACGAPQPRELPDVLSVAGPAVPVVEVKRHECRTCGERSGWFNAADQEAPEATWDADHAATTGHARTHLWTVTRQTAQTWAPRRRTALRAELRPARPAFGPRD